MVFLSGTLSRFCVIYNNGEPELMSRVLINRDDLATIDKRILIVSRAMSASKHSLGAHWPHFHITCHYFCLYTADRKIPSI